MLLLLGSPACVPKDKGPLFTCKACFRDNPSWCAVHQDGPEAMSKGDEKRAMNFAKLALCSDYEDRTDGGVRAFSKCYDRSEDDFLITCTSRIGDIPRHPGFKVN